jgi:hypothetical protein
MSILGLLDQASDSHSGPLAIVQYVTKALNVGYCFLARQTVLGIMLVHECKLHFPCICFRISVRT